jgi:hypothetical protein
MALINILAQSNDAADWENILDKYSRLSLSYVEVFPIPKQLGFGQDAIGINVHHGYDSKHAVISDLKKVVDLLMSLNFTLTELYDGVMIVPGNMDALFNGLLTS